MHIGHGRLCVPVPHRIPTLLHGPGCNRGCPIVLQYWADLQSVHEFRCSDNTASNAKCQRVLVLALCDFWPTACKTVRPMLSDRCLSVLSVLSCPVCLSVTLVYCGQTVEWIKMKLGAQVGLGPGHIVLDGKPALPSPKGHSPPNFRPISVVAKWLDGSRCHLVGM